MKSWSLDDRMDLKAGLLLILLSAITAGGVSTAASAQTSTLGGSPAPSEFDGSYPGLQGYINSPDETRSPSGRTSGCSVPSSKPPTLTIQNGVATMPWCHGSCVMTGQVNKSGYLEMRNPDSNDIISFNFTPKAHTNLEPGRK